MGKVSDKIKRHGLGLQLARKIYDFSEHKTLTLAMNFRTWISTSIRDPWMLDKNNNRQFSQKLTSAFSFVT
jgi:hypothetical protein